MRAFRPLRSTSVTRFHATMSLSDSRLGHACGYVFPCAFGSLPATPAGLPGSSIDLSTRAVPSHPGEFDECTCPLLVRQWQASGSLAPWPLALSVTRPNRVRLRYGSRVHRTRLRSFDYCLAHQRTQREADEINNAWNMSRAHGALSALQTRQNDADGVELKLLALCGYAFYYLAWFSLRPWRSLRLCVEI